MEVIVASPVNNGNQSKNARSLVATITNNVSKHNIFTRLEFMFSLSGGHLKRFTSGFT